MKYRVLIGIPVRGIYDEVKPKTKVCLELMAARTQHATELFMCRGQQITQNSYNIVTKALAEGWDYLLYTGDDITFPPWALDRMISHDQDIVGGVCTWKTPPYWVPAGMDDKGTLKNVIVSPEDVQTKKVKEVHFVGSGFMLIKRKALQAVEELYRDKVYREIPAEYRWMCPVPYFPVTFDPDRNVITGSDFAFCRAARMAGQRIFLDCGIVCGHRWEGEYNITDHWKWIEQHGTAKDEPRFPEDVVQFVAPDKDKIYWGEEAEPIPVTITSSGNEYHALEHVWPILKGYYAPLRETTEHGRTKLGYVIGFHIHDEAQFTDYMQFASSFDKVIVHWVGSDILNLPKWITDGKKAELNHEKFIHLVEDERLLSEMAPYLDNVKVLPIPTAKMLPPDPLPDNFTVAIYYPKHRHDFHYGDVMRGVIEAMPDVKFKLFHLLGEKPDFNYPNMAWLGRLENNEYGLQVARSSATLRLSKHDGRPFTVAEFAIAGRRFVTNFDMPHTVRVPDVPTVEDVVKALRSIQNETQPDLQASAYYAAQNDHRVYRAKIKELLGLSSEGYDYQAYWDGRYAQGSRGAGGPVPLSKEAEWVNAVITKAVKDSESESVLDVGCGSMVRWEKLPVRPDAYTGVDISRKALDFAQQKYPGASFFVADVTKDAIPQADAVIAVDVLPHIKKQDFPDTVKRLFRSANKTVVIKTSLGVNDGHYQSAHDWSNGTVPLGWQKVSDGQPPDNTVARLWVFRKQEVSVVA